MKYRCRYCRGAFEPGGSQCPHCGAIALPPPGTRPARPASAPATERRREASASDRLNRMASLLAARRPGGVLLIVGGLVFVCAIFSIRVPPTPEPTDAERAQSARHNLGVLRTALDSFRVDCGRYPTTAEGLPALTNAVGLPGWRGPYIIALLPDPWRRPYAYQWDGGRLVLLSPGPDAAAGTVDDVLAPTPDDAGASTGRVEGVDVRVVNPRR
jgi:general secretion pathway protein G